MVDQRDDAARREARLRAARELALMQIEEVPDPETLSRQLQATYELDHLYNDQDGSSHGEGA